MGPFHLVPLVALVAFLAVTAGLAVFAGAVVSDQEHRLLVERTNEVDLVLSTSITSVSTELSVLAHLPPSAGTSGFEQAARAELPAKSAGQGVILARPQGTGYVVVAAVGQGFSVGQVLTGEAASTMRAATTTPELVSSSVYGAGASRSIGFALDAQGGIGGSGPDGAGGMVVYRQSVLGPVHAPVQSSTAAFADVRVVLYASTRPDSSQVIVATSTDLPLQGEVRYVPLMAGATTWLVGVAAEQPLVGSLAAAAPWVTGAAGALGSVLIFLLLEVSARRREAALEALSTEHRFAEALQRRLLPTVPQLAGLDVASRYVAGSDYQQVGGDWFDVFPLPSGQTAVVIGDVMGHDVEAAATMSQLRAAVRAYAAEGGDPAWVVERLATLVDLYDLAAVVTVVYGVIDPPAGDGTRRFVWANAGHPPPLLCHPDGTLQQLSQGSSTLLGAPATLPRATGQVRLGPGSTLLLYTDGLVEVQGENLGASIDHLGTVLGGTVSGDSEAICRRVLGAQLKGRQRDDVALLVVKTAPAPPREDPASESAASRS